jgi:hypothetical protein
VSLLAWTFLFGAVAVAGPIVAHLLSKPRFRRLPFTMLRFLRRGQSQTHSRRRLRDLLILLVRCAIVVTIAVLFAQPVLLVQTPPPQRTAAYYLALDDSMSMAYRDGDKTLLERMTAAALDRIERAPDEATFNLYGLASGRSSQGLTRGEAAAAAKRLKAVPAKARLAGFLSAIRQARQAASPADTISALVISDFTPSVLEEFMQVREPAAVDEIQCEPITPETPADNTAISAARVAGVTEDIVNLDVTLCRCGPADRTCTLTARPAGGKALCAKEMVVAPGQSKVVRLQMDPGPQWRRSEQACLPIELSLSPGDGLAEDDVYRLAVYAPPPSETKIVLVHEGDEAFLFETAIQALCACGSVERPSLVKVPQGRLSSRELAGADLAVFSHIPPGSTCRMSDLKDFVQRGGRLVFFTSRAEDSESAQPLWREGLLAALPRRWIGAVTYPQTEPCLGASVALDPQAARGLCNYRLDQIALKGCWQCEPAEKAECLWGLSGGQGLLYALPCGRGLSLVVNTSIDDSLGLLAKSAAWVAFCRCLIGKDDPVQQFGFCPGERPVLPIAGDQTSDPRTAVKIENCDGSKGWAAAQANVLTLPPPAGTGWMKTIDPPVFYAGVNLPAGETDLTAPTPRRVADAVQRAFITKQPADVPALAAEAPPIRSLRHIPIWPIFAWAAIALLVLESMVANRLKR